MNKPLIVIFTAVALDAVGIGLIFPILPRLVEDITHARNVALYIGVLTALYAAMQFVFAPVLGSLSDRLGRRPVLLIALAGAAVNYVLMALAPSLAFLILGRAIAGLTSANISVATAYITDISPEETRASRFGIFNAMFRIGFVLGPVLGGVLGDHWLRLPFIAAAVLNAGNLLFAVLFLPESRTPTHEKIDLRALNPLRPLQWAFSKKTLLPTIATFFILNSAGEVYGTCWALWGNDVFGWNGLWIGLSLGAFGICQSLAQAFLPGPVGRRAIGRPRRHSRGLCRVDRNGVHERRLDGVCDHAHHCACWYRDSGSAISRNSDGGPRTARAISGSPGICYEHGFHRGAAWILDVLLRRQGAMAGCDMAVCTGGQRHGGSSRAKPPVSLREKGNNSVKLNRCENQSVA